jgi:predicted dehydrogenase
LCRSFPESFIPHHEEHAKNVNRTNTTGNSSPPHIAIVGCGAIAARFHLPALRRLLPPEFITLVDLDGSRASALGEGFGVRQTATALEDVLPHVSGIILATPPHLHRPHAMAAIAAGVPVLTEKPVADTIVAAEDMVRESRVSGVPIAVNNTRRYFASYRAAHAVCRSGELGTLQRIHLEHGEAFDWPCAPGAYFGKYAGGRGVLLDLGAHTLDLICWWLDAKPAVVTCWLDGMGGTEAYAELHAVSGPVQVDMRISWLSKLQNLVRLEFTGGAVEVPSHSRTEYFVERNGTRKRHVTPAQSPDALADDVVGNFLGVVRGVVAPGVHAADVLPSLQLLEECYERAARRAMPWFDQLNAYQNV